MTEKIGIQKLPSGLLRLALRLPIWLYRANLGWLLGHRFVLLTHLGRNSGLLRYTILEVVRYDKIREECVVASGWGDRSDWLKNISVNPKIGFQVGNRRFVGIAERLNPEAVEYELQDYARRHPVAFRELSSLLGYNLEGTQADIRSASKILPMFIFKPQEEAT